MSDGIMRLSRKQSGYEDKMTVSEKSRWLILLVVSSALFLIVIDMTVLYTALPSLARDLGTSASEKLWIINAYALVVAGLLPGLGTLGDRIGHKRMFIAGLSVFGIASLIAAYSPSPPILIGGRALLAIGAAMMMPATLSIIRLTFDDERERGLAIGIWGAVASGGAAVGPLIGGILLEYFWWGSVFLINVPIVIVALVAAAVFIPRRKGSREVGWDPVGSLQILVGLVGVAYAIEELAREAPSLLEAAAAAVIGALALAIFIRRQRRSATPMFDLTLFENRDFTLGVVVALVSSFSVVGLELVLSQRLQLVLGYSPLQAALFVLPGSLLAFIAGPLAGWAAPRHGAGRVMGGALLLGGLGVTGLFFAADAGRTPQLLCLSIFGLGLGASIAVASHAIMTHAPAERAGMAASVEEVAFELGGAIGITILGSLLAGIYSVFLVPPQGLLLPPSVLEGIDQALRVAETLPADAAQRLTEAVHGAFDAAYLTTLALDAALLVVIAFIASRAGAAQRAQGQP
jgi:MFS transporter, DHA2 family, multidrug resistance protein